MATSMINGAELYHEITGRGDCLVLTHGSWTDAAGWAPAVELLAKRYRVVVRDRRGHSHSQTGDGPGSRAQDAAARTGLGSQASARRAQAGRAPREVDDLDLGVVLRAGLLVHPASDGVALAAGPGAPDDDRHPQRALVDGVNQQGGGRLFYRLVFQSTRCKTIVAMLSTRAPHVK